ncbi:MAG: ATP-binding protein [Gammaproteobacteria bacterium]|nr:ATP-binding protein [Gammaproteobacteria bacterium]
MEPGIRARGKSSLLSQALRNLLENAIKFTPSGGRVSVDLASCEAGFVVSVADTGPGIAEADRERVLQRFERLDAARSTPGRGLGLSVVSAIAAPHGAELVLSDNAPELRVSLRFA